MEYGGAIKKVFCRIANKVCPKINIIKLMETRKRKKQYVGEIEKNIKKVDRIVIWRSSFGWNVPLYQRPQHIAKCLSDKKTLVLYEVTNETDDVSTIKEQKENLYLVNFNNPLIKKWIMEEVLTKTKKDKYIQIYSTNWSMTVTELKKYIENGYKVIYEYIDDLNPTLAGTKELPVNIKEKYEYVMKHKEVYVVVTAQKIMEDVIEKRGTENVVLACNGVDYEFYNNIDENFEFEDEFKNILEQNKPIIGYYGALATWFDYELIKKLAEERKDYNIVLFGIKYDDSLEKNHLDKYKNIYFLGSRNYLVLKNYANKFSVCTIPFLINSITEATSPVKLFEYMALKKPIVTTNMHECTKYNSVMIAKSHEEYIELIDKAISMANSKDMYKEYFELLNSEALENDWGKKAEAIINLISKDEQ